MPPFLPSFLLVCWPPVETIRVVPFSIEALTWTTEGWLEELVEPIAEHVTVVVTVIEGERSEERLSY